MSDERQQSEFNMAVSYLNRLNALFYAADDASMSLDTYSWYHSLMCIYRELSTEMNPKEIESMNTFVSSVHELLVDNDKHNARLKRVEVKPEVYNKLHEFELHLRKIMKEAGLQNKMMDDASKALK